MVNSFHSGNDVDVHQCVNSLWMLWAVLCVGIWDKLQHIAGWWNCFLSDWLAILLLFIDQSF